MAGVELPGEFLVPQVCGRGWCSALLVFWDTGVVWDVGRVFFRCGLGLFI